VPACEPNEKRDEAHSPARLSWEDAKNAAGQWLAAANIPRDLSGQSVDLREHENTLPEKLLFRRMVLRAAERLLKQRGAVEIILPTTRDEK
jgi:hypothetical protein